MQKQLFYQTSKLAVQLDFTEWYINQLELMQFGHGHFEGIGNRVIIASLRLDGENCQVGMSYRNLIDFALQISTRKQYESVIFHPPVIVIVQRLDGMSTFITKLWPECDGRNILCIEIGVSFSKPTQALQPKLQLHDPAPNMDPESSNMFVG